MVTKGADNCRMRRITASLATALTVALSGLLPVLPVLVGTPSTSAVNAPVNAPVTVHLSAPDAVLAGLVSPAVGSAFTIGDMLNGVPIHWNPCAPIHWQFRPAGAPVGGLTVLKQALAQISTATGFRFVYDGTVAAVPNTAWLPKTAALARPLLIGWGDGATSDLLRGKPTSVLGVTRTAWFGVTRDGVSSAAIKAAVVVLDRTDHLPLTGPISWRTVALHELSHAMGLDHAGSSRQLMYPVLSRTLTGLQAGDLEGLRRVGKAAGCTTV